MLKKVDGALNSITMYRLVLYCLLFLVGVSLGLSFFGVLRIPFIQLFASLMILLTVGFVANLSFAKLYGVAQNYESGLITTLILYFILIPPKDQAGYLAIAGAVVAALASKYIVTWRGAHIFNPAAFGAAAVSIFGIALAGWWTATPSMFLFVLLIGLIILRKTRQFELFACFFVASTGLLLLRHIDIQTILFSFPIIFFGAVMLTEPATSPNTKKWRLVYGVLVGALFGAGLSIVSSPHIALLVGNILAFAVSFRTATKLQLVAKTKIANNIYDFSFEPIKSISFFTGQYMEWTLPASLAFKPRGNRRTFTIASSPLQKQLHIGVKMYQPSSDFKQKLQSLEIGDYIYGSHVAGDFTLPQDKTKKLAFVAGGIGITPFIAMFDHLLRTKNKRDIVLFYFVNTKEDIAYQDVLKKVENMGVKVVTLVGPEARLDTVVLQKYSPDYQKRIFYLSGPPPMVNSYKKSLKKLSVRTIHTDYFFGY